MNYGKFNYNVQVMSKKKGMLFVARSSSVHHTVEDYVHCQFCFTFCVRSELYRHFARCPLKEEGGGVISFCSTDRLLLDGALQQDGDIPEMLRLKVLHSMLPDHRTRTVKGDRSILRFGTSLLNKLGPKRSNDIAQRMRQLARLSIRSGTIQNNERSKLDQ
jgi:hypothetical protein